MDRVTYHEQTDMENILKLREVLRTLPEFSGIISVPLIQQQPQKPEFLMRTTSGFSFSSL